MHTFYRPITIFREQSTSVATERLLERKKLSQSTIFSRTVLRLRIYHCSPTFQQHIVICTMLVIVISQSLTIGMETHKQLRFF
jgi:hypothetical protein